MFNNNFMTLPALPNFDADDTVGVYDRSGSLVQTFTDEHCASDWLAVNRPDEVEGDYEIRAL